MMSNGSTGVFMRRASFIAFTVGGMLVLGPVSDVWAQSGAGGTPRPGWYVGGGIGANWASDIDQEGWNRDPLCYPTDACFDADPVPDISGYRWRYDIDAAADAVFEISAGLILARTRLELSLAQRKNSLDQSGTAGAPPTSAHSVTTWVRGLGCVRRCESASSTCP